MAGGDADDDTADGYVAEHDGDDDYDVDYYDANFAYSKRHYFVHELYDCD